MKSFSLNQLAEGIRDRHVGAERKRLVEKWTRTGLLRNLDGYKRESMAQILENTAAHILRESSALSTGGGNVASSGQMSGFTNIAFPIVRRVFGGLVANELVSIQPMSLPSGLIFYLDYTYGSNVGGGAGMGLSNSATLDTYDRGASIYTAPPGKGIQSGSLAAGGMYDFANVGYSKVHSGSTAVTGSGHDFTSQIGAWGNGVNNTFVADAKCNVMSGTNGVNLSYDPQLDADLVAGTISNVQFLYMNVSDIRTAIPTGDFLAVNQIALFSFSTTTTTAGNNNGSATTWGQAYQSGAGVLNLRRLNKRGNWSSTAFVPDALNGTHIQLVLKLAGGTTPTVTGYETMSMALTDALSVQSSDGVQTGATLTVPSFESDFGSSPTPAIPEIDIKIESIAVTADTRKLRARWSPELAQDLNAYHSMDAEVELTSILSEQIALEIDREILNDLVTQANGANMYWSRAPGQFVNKLTGQPVNLASSLQIGPQFTGTVREWYETLIETIIDVANTIHRKTLRGSANFCVTSPDVATILEASVLYKPKFSIDGAGQVATPFTIGAEAIGTLSNRFTVYKDPYFPRNRILIGYKGGTYLETGYAYCPYVPVIITPTLFDPETFTPRKGVMTRFAKKMIRSDFYGTVTVLNLNVI